MSKRQKAQDPDPAAFAEQFAVDNEGVMTFRYALGECHVRATDIVMMTFQRDPGFTIRVHVRNVAAEVLLRGKGEENMRPLFEYMLKQWRLFSGTAPSGGEDDDDDDE
jgi:hypothetical protein